MPVYSRASRRYRFVPGKGGNMIVRQYDTDGNIDDSNIVTFDVQQYLIRNMFTLENTSHSGDAGGENYTQVGHAWTFAANVSYPGAVLLGAQPLAAAFVEQFMGSSRGVDMIFNIGDPEWWALHVGDGQQRTYRGKAKLEAVEIDSIADGTKTVKLNVIGRGEGLLYSMIGGEEGNPQSSEVVAPLVGN